MPLVLIKREDGTAFISETVYVEGNPLPWEGGRQLAPDEVVDGKKVSDWPTGIFTVTSVERAGTERFTDWNADTLESENDDS